MRCHNTHIPQYFCIYGVENCREDRGRVFKRFSSWVQLGPVLSLSRPRGAKLQGFTGLTDFYPAHPVPEILAITDFSAQLTLIQSSDSRDREQSPLLPASGAKMFPTGTGAFWAF